MEGVRGGKEKMIQMERKEKEGQKVKGVRKEGWTEEKNGKRGREGRMEVNRKTGLQRILGEKLWR